MLKEFFPCIGRIALADYGCLRLERTILNFRRLGKPAISILLLASLLFTIALASSPALHEYFHHDAGSAEHSCAVTLFTHGQLTVSDTAVFFVALVLMFLFRLPVAPIAQFFPVDRRLGFGRAPPAFFRLP